MPSRAEKDEWARAMFERGAAHGPSAPTDRETCDYRLNSTRKSARASRKIRRTSARHGEIGFPAITDAASRPTNDSQRMSKIPVSGPWITQKEIDYVTDAVSTAWYGNANVYHERFETAFARYIGTGHAIALPSCTSAIHLSLLALGIGPGDEVIVPETTWIASSAPVTYVGATPVFADVDPQSWCLSAEAFARCITPRTRAVIPVDLYGNTSDWDAIREVAVAHGVAIIEDAAEAIGTRWRGTPCGAFGHTGVFSFHGSKTLTTGEGGMLVTDDSSLRDRILFLRDHGRPAGDTTFTNTEVAWKYKMSSMQAALGLAQLERVEELVSRKREIFGWYRDGLAHRTDLTLNHEADGAFSTYWMVTGLFPEACGTKFDIIRRLSEAGIDSRPIFSPLSSLPAYAATASALGAQNRNPVAYRIGARGVNFPSGFNLDADAVARICAEVCRILDSCHR
jgi:perosamine synthetase